MDYDRLNYDKKTINTIEVLYEKSIKNTELKLASIISLDKLLPQIIKLKRRLYTIFILMGVLVIIISFFTVRYVGSFYEKKLESKNLDLENDIINLTKLNLGVFTYQQKIALQQKEKETDKVEVHNDNQTENQKNRLLTYKGNELIPVFFSDIAYVFTENSITYVVDKDGKKTVSNASLDEIYGNLDVTLFFRANRQYIVHITNIEKIIKYGNSQLKILILNSDADILIGKNKASEFKKWLNI